MTRGFRRYSFSGRLISRVLCSCNAGPRSSISHRRCRLFQAALKGLRRTAPGFPALSAALLPVGFTQRDSSPNPRWALTPPFHLCISAVLFCCTFPEVALGGRYPLPSSVGARTFLRQNLSVFARDRAAGRKKNDADTAAFAV